MLRPKRIVATLFATTLIAAGASAPASAQPVVTGGLINVTLVDVVDVRNVTVQVPIGIAVNVCDVNAAVLLAAVRDTGSARCEADADAIAFAERHARP